MNSSNAYLLTALSNLHVGKGDSNYGVIDNLVQRDPLRDLPCIYASSLKGAMREHYEEVLKKIEEAATIFGGKDDNHSKGTYIFHEALLLSIPVRAKLTYFYNAVSPTLIDECIQRIDLFCDESLKSIRNILSELTVLKPEKGNAIIFSSILNDVKNEESEHFNKFDFKGKPNPMLEKLLGSNFMVVNDEDLKTVCADTNLPLIARNHLENGKSLNLFYEQVLPRQTRFLFIVTQLTNTENLFDQNVNNQNVQIGANATIGYGFCQVSNLKNL